MTEKKVAVTVVLLIVLSAFAVVYSKHQSRLLYAQQQKVQRQLELLDAHWGLLLLEEATITGDGEVERIAHQELNMFVPTHDQLINLE